jgi:galactose mutarotase-like enzyme
MPPVELTLRDEATAAVATIEPARGGLVTRFDIGARRVLFMDLETLRDPSKNVRGGIPVLFPSPGKLASDAWAHAGRRGSMKQHGFARNLPWQVGQTSIDAVTLTLESNEDTLAQYPWDFTVEQTITLRATSLRLQHTVSNRGTSAMPFGFGFHPYFHVPDHAKRETQITTLATRAFDNVSKRAIELPSLAPSGKIDLSQKEVDLHLFDHGSSRSELRSPLGTVQLSASPEYTHWVVWTLAGRDFVCLEPWTCPGNALNDGERLLSLDAGESRTMWFEIGCSSAAVGIGSGQG